jgi:hypothetical protein
MEDLEKRVIEDLPVVSSVGFHAGDKTHKAGVYANLRFCAASPYGGCGAKQVGPICKSSERPTNVDCFRELGRVIQRDHGPTCIQVLLSSFFLGIDWFDSWAFGIDYQALW